MSGGFLVTGGCGFIGTNLVRLLLARFPEEEVWNLDLLTYAGSGGNLDDLAAEPRYRFVRGDVSDLRRPGDLHPRLAAGGFRAVLHLAAESHVDRSLFDAAAFLHTNVEGTRVMLEGAREAGVRLYVQVSTDEVYGSLGPTGAFTEESPLKPSSPYSASKAAADLLALSYHRTFGQDVVVTRCSNNYGPYQFPEKLIPLMISRALADEPLPVYGDGRNIRDWIHVEDHCTGIVLALERGVAGRVYNLGGDAERENLAVVCQLLAELGKPESLIRFVADRPGHDRRYAMDARRARAELGFSPRYRFELGLARTIQWYVEHEAWSRRVRDGSYRRYLEDTYRSRLEAAAPCAV
ncbi:MAG: dTDP-glucose 4,6-dehydratase [Gemmatimonadaceae bacterium]|nr:dTDP-glucose 4,6-dehydratase [Gemmatimonadaceae bacterium]